MLASLAYELGRGAAVAVAALVAVALAKLLARGFWRALRREMATVVGDIVTEQLMKPNGGGSLYDLRVAVDGMRADVSTLQGEYAKEVQDRQLAESVLLGRVEILEAVSNNRPPPPPPIGGTVTR